MRGFEDDAAVVHNVHERDQRQYHDQKLNKQQPVLDAAAVGSFQIQE